MDGLEGRGLDFGQPLNECEIAPELEDWSTQYPPLGKIVGPFLYHIVSSYSFDDSKLV
jgi:hypothetical protein